MDRVCVSYTFENRIFQPGVLLRPALYIMKTEGWTVNNESALNGDAFAY